MKLCLSGWYNGLIGLENKVIDLSRFEIRKRANEEDLKRYYGEFLEKIKNFSDYFYDKEAFEKTFKEISNEKKPKLISKMPRYPGFGFSGMKYYSTVFDGILNPEKKRKDKYFVAAHCEIRFTLKGSVFEKLVDETDENIIRCLEEMVEKESKIEIPNDRTQKEIKGSTFHEALHYFISSYQLTSGRLFTQDKEGVSKKERHIVENIINESVVEYLTDLLLEDDKEALFEQRWTHYKLTRPQINLLFSIATGISTGWLIGESFSNPYITPLIPMPYISYKVIYNKYKNAKRKKLTQKREKIEFKI